MLCKACGATQTRLLTSSRFVERAVSLQSLVLRTLHLQSILLASLHLCRHRLDLQTLLHSPSQTLLQFLCPTLNLHPTLNLKPLLPFLGPTLDLQPLQPLLAFLGPTLSQQPLPPSTQLWLQSWRR